MVQLITKKDAAQLVGYHPEHVMRLSRAGAFPKAVKLGRGQNCAVRFVLDEVEAWLAAKMAERDATAA
jgi:predicted DNA-binding transcriptional regulator AlpA